MSKLLSSEIDITKFDQCSGTLEFLPVVAAAFLRQLPKWRVDFEAALAAQKADQLLDLLHKMKGSCYAVAAYKAAELIQQLEAAHAPGMPLKTAGLGDHLERVEAELRSIVANPPRL